MRTSRRLEGGGCSPGIFYGAKFYFQLDISE